VRFLVDRCVGRRLAEWLRRQGHDVVDAREEGPDPGDLALLRRATAEGRILVTIDTDFGHLVYRGGEPQAGLVRLPDVPSERRILLLAHVLERHSPALEAGGLAAGRAAGGRTFTQDEASCVIYGMPRSAVEAGVVDEVVALDRIAARLVEVLG